MATTLRDTIKRVRGKTRQNGSHGEPRLPLLLEQLEVVLMDVEDAIDGENSLKDWVNDAMESGAVIDPRALDVILTELHNEITNAHSLARRARRALHPTIRSRKT